jgi:hypothetical protein
MVYLTMKKIQWSFCFTMEKFKNKTSKSWAHYSLGELYLFYVISTLICQRFFALFPTRNTKKVSCLWTHQWSHGWYVEMKHILTVFTCINLFKTFQVSYYSPTHIHSNHLTNLPTYLRYLPTYVSRSYL